MAQAVDAPDEKKEDFKLVEVKDIPKKMKALQLMQYDKDMSKALKVNEVDVPECGKDQILIKNCSVSLNPVDWKIAMGYLAGMAKVDFPHTIGRDYAGIIVKIGENVSANKDNKFKVGMRVAGMVPLFGGQGSFSEYMVTTPDCVCYIANDLSYDIGAAVPLVTLTPYQALMNHTGLKDTKDLKIIILGGSSSCGLAAIQIAKNQGAKEIATTSSQVDLCTKMGATKVYNYKDKNAATWSDDLKGKSYDILFDCVGAQDSWDLAQTVLKEKDAIFISIVGGGKPGGPNKDKDNPNTKYLFFMQNGTKEMQDMYGMVNDKKIVPTLDEDTPYALDKWADMLAKSIAHKAHGKLVLRFCACE